MLKKMEKKEYKQNINMTDELMTRINELISHYPDGKQKSALLPVLHAVQDAHDNWLSLDLMDEVARILKIKPIEVYEVVTFYTMFNQKPIGQYMFEFCRTSCCCLRNAEDIIDYTCTKLGIKAGETTSDGVFSIVTVECLGSCGNGPVLQLGDFNHEHLTEDKIDALIDDCRQGKIKLH